ncbi:MAG TPA: hypothetical protein VM580_07890 [Labilithrix sp.]|nr:hypothetical protein [Labilithrix sp.]
MAMSARGGAQEEMGTTKYTKHNFGQSEIWYEPDTGFTYVVQVGQPNREETIEMCARLTEFSQKSGEPIFLLADERGATGFGSVSGVTGVLASTEVLRQECYAALFGGSFAFRVILTLMAKGLAASGSPVVVTLPSDEAAARTWLTEMRSAYLARRAKMTA